MGKVINMKELGDVVVEIEDVFKRRDLNRFEKWAVLKGVENRIKHFENRESASDMLSTGWIGKLLNPVRKDQEKQEE